ncbi:MAG: hypothetical protein AAGJ28_19150 [Pseudomonadota bacterium]
MIRSLSVLAAVTLLSACGLDAGQLVRPGVPTGTFVMFNQGNAAITAVTISTCEANSHGLNRLQDGYVIQPGRGARFTLSAGCYDVAAGYGLGDRSYAYAQRRLTVSAGRETRLNITGDN